MHLQLNRQIMDSNKVFAYVTGLGFEGFVPSPIQPKAAKPYLDWKGGKIPVDIWHQVLAFFRDHAKDEVQVRLYYNTETLEWRPWAFPQRYPTGMTTRELPDHPNTAVDANLFPDPWVRLGSVHHHCSAGAFQSGTDHADEATVPGLHITMGKLDQPKWELHSRVCMRLPGAMNPEGTEVLYGPTQAFFDAQLQQWFDLPIAVKAVLPTAVHTTVLRELLTTPPDAGYGYPNRWKDNLVRYEHPNGVHAGANNTASHSGHSSGIQHRDTTQAGAPTATKTWETLTVPKLEVICGMIETYHGPDGKFMVQTVETYDWKRHAFHSIEACQGILRSCGLEQINMHVWAMPPDVAMAKKCIQDASEQEARDELERTNAAETQSMHTGMGMD